MPSTGSKAPILHRDAIGWFQILVHFLKGPLGPSCLGQVQLYRGIRQVFNKFY